MNSHPGILQRAGTAPNSFVGVPTAADDGEFGTARPPYTSEAIERIAWQLTISGRCIIVRRVSGDPSFRDIKVIWEIPVKQDTTLIKSERAKKNGEKTHAATEMSIIF